MSDYYGDFQCGQAIRKRFNTVNAAGGSVDLSTDGTFRVFRLDGTTASTTTGITFSENFNSKTGYHDLTILTASDATFYLPGYDYDVMVDAAVVAGETQNASVFCFSLQNRYAPGLMARGFARSGGTTSQILFPAAFSFASNQLVGATANVTFGTGFGNSRLIDAMSGDDASVSPPLSSALDTTSAVEVYATAPASTATANVWPANITHVGGQPIGSPTINGYLPVTIKVGSGATTGELQIANGVLRAVDGSGNPLATFSVQASQGTTIGTINTNVGTATTAAQAAETAATAAQTAATNAPRRPTRGAPRG